MDRKKFIELVTLSTAVLGMPGIAGFSRAKEKISDIKFGLVTYQWGKDWDISTIIKNMTKSKTTGVELKCGPCAWRRYIFNISTESKSKKTV